MAFPQGIDFRSTSGFVTDPTNYAFHASNNFAATYPTTTPQGNTVGWETTGTDSRDRSAATGDARTAGIHLNQNAGAYVFRIDLPATGTYGIQAAFGDDGSTQTMTAQFEDTTTVFATPMNNVSTGGLDHYVAANGTQETSTANWATNNPAAGGGTDEITHSFASTIFRTIVTGGATFVIASLFIRSTGGGGRTIAAANTLGDFTDAAPFQNIDHIAGAELLSPFVDSASFVNIDHIIAADILGILPSAAVLKNLSHLSASDPLNGFQSNAAFHNSAGPALTNMYPWARRRRR